MAFNFLGTMTSSELQSLRSFLSIEIESTNEHINTLINEIAELKETRADLEIADKAMGGNTLNEMKENDVIGTKIRHDDINPAILTSQIKSIFIPNIK